MTGLKIFIAACVIAGADLMLMLGCAVFTAHVSDMKPEQGAPRLTRFLYGNLYLTTLLMLMALGFQMLAITALV